MLARCEGFRRRLPAVEHPLINQVGEQADATELGGKLPSALADRFRITRAEASRRIHDAADLGERKAITGDALPPLLTATAEAQRAGCNRAGPRGGYSRLRAPTAGLRRRRNSPEGRGAACPLGGEHRPDELSRLADKLTDCLNPDGNFTDDDRARRRGITIGNQGFDGMSPISGYLTPEARATLDAVFAKLAAPGMCNPVDQEPVVDGQPSQKTIDADTQAPLNATTTRCNAAGRALLASGDLGQHNGLPATIIVTTTLRELEAKAGRGLTGGGTLLPMSDVIRLASHAHHYLCIFDKGKAIALYHTKRLASPGQRMVCTPRTAGVHIPVATCRAITPKSITARPTPDAIPATSTTRRSAAVPHHHF